MIKIISRGLWLVLSKDKDYTFFCDLRLLIGCIDYKMDGRIYRVQSI